MNARTLAQGFLKVAVLLGLAASWSAASWLATPTREPSPAHLTDVAGLGSGMSAGAAQAVLDRWRTPFRVGPARPIDRPGGPPARALRITLQAGPSPFGTLCSGSLLFLEDHLYWVDLDIEGSILEARVREHLGTPTGSRWPARYWRLDVQEGWAYMTGDRTRHHLTLAFHRAILEAGLSEAGSLGTLKASFEDEVRDALNDGEDPGDYVWTREVPGR